MTDPLEEAQSGTALVGRSTTLAARLSAEEVEAFGRLSRDDHPIHVDDAFARRAGLPGCIVQGSFLVGLMAGASTKFFEEAGRPALSYGYDRIRFTGQLPVGSSVTVTYTVTEADPGRRRLFADVSASDDSGRLIAIARHITKLL